MSWYCKQNATWRKDLITYNSHPWIMFSFNPSNWLVIIWRERGRRDCLKLDVQGQRGRGGEFWKKGWRGVSKIGQFSWTSYVYRPFLVYQTVNVKVDISEYLRLFSLFLIIAGGLLLRKMLQIYFNLKNLFINQDTKQTLW